MTPPLIEKPATNPLFVRDLSDGAHPAVFLGFFDTSESYETVLAWNGGSTKETRYRYFRDLTFRVADEERILRFPAKADPTREAYLQRLLRQLISSCGGDIGTPLETTYGADVTLHVERHSYKGKNLISISIGERRAP